MEKLNNWNKKFLETETELDPTQWPKMLALLNEVERNKSSMLFNKIGCISVFLFMGLIFLLFTININFYENKATELKKSDNVKNESLEAMVSRQKNLPNPHPTNYDVELSPENTVTKRLTSSTQSNLKRAQSSSKGSKKDITIQSHSTNDQKTMSNYKRNAEYSKQVLTKTHEDKNSSFLNPPITNTTDNIQQTTLENHALHDTKTKLKSLSLLTKQDYFLSSNLSQGIPDFYLRDIRPTIKVDDGLFKNKIELQLFDNSSAVFGAKLFLKRKIDIRKKLFLSYGLGVSWTRGIEGYRNNIQIVTDSSSIRRQEGYSFQSDINGSLELAYQFNKFSFRCGMEISYGILNSLRTADSESFFDPDKPFEFKIYQNYNEFEINNRLGYIINGGVDYRINKSYTLGFGVYKRINSYFKQPNELIASKNNIAPEFEFRVAKYF